MAEIRIINQSASESANYALALELLPPLEADFNIDYVVDELDLTDIASHWLEIDCLNSTQPCFNYNLSSSDSIDFSDYSVFAEKWLDYDARYYSP